MIVDAFGQSLCKGKNCLQVSLKLFCTISIQTKASTLKKYFDFVHVETDTYTGKVDLS